jgi:hypothetical protein
VLSLVSILFAALAFNSPWAEVAFGESGTTNHFMTKVMFSYDSVMLGGCSRGTALGLDAHLDFWVLIGKYTWTAIDILWLIFFISIFFTKRRGKVPLGIAWGISAITLLTLSNPFIECLTVRIPPPLVYLHSWHIGVPAGLFAFGSLAIGIEAYLLLLKTRQEK